MQTFFVVGLNHVTAPLELRERVTFSPQDQADILARFCTQFPHCEIVILSTCNRVEIYVGATDVSRVEPNHVLDFFSSLHDVRPAALSNAIYIYRDRAAAAHLFGVASSLDSMVVGETEILGQVRNAYEYSRELGAAGPVLNPLFQRAIAAGRAVMNSIHFDRAQNGFAVAAVTESRRALGSLVDKRLLCVGTGKMALALTEAFANAPVKSIAIAGRQLTNAQILAARVGANAINFHEIENQFGEADIVLTSTAASALLISHDQFDSATRTNRKMRLLFDLAVPRNIDPEISRIESVRLYNLDDLHRSIRAADHANAREIESAWRIVDRHVCEYETWNRRRRIGPAIAGLLQRIRRERVDARKEQFEPATCPAI